MACQICISNSKFYFTCKCEFKSCCECSIKYFSSIPEPQCPNCKEPISHQTIIRKFPVSLVDSYRVTRAERLLLSEKNRLHETSRIYNELKQHHKNVFEICKELKTLRNNRENKYRIIELRNQCNKEKTDISIKSWYLKRGFDEWGEMKTEDSIQKNIFKCPLDKCTGYVTDGSCLLCKKEICENCETAHTGQCDKNLVENVKVIKNETKGCPSCHTRIYKLWGCDQMWCTQCNTAFSWNTGQKITGTIHNPHYFEWLRNNGKEEEIERKCNDEITYGHIHHMFKNGFKMYFTGSNAYENIRNPEFNQYFYIEHIPECCFTIREGRIRTKYSYNINPANLARYRLRAVKENFGDKKWINLLKAELKRCDKNYEISQLYNFLADGYTDIINDLYNHVDEKNPDKIKKLLEETDTRLKEVCSYVSSEFSFLSRIYNSSFPKFSCPEESLYVL